MTPLTTLKDALYQEFFTGKGTLALECINLKNTQGESWEFCEKRGSLFLKGDNDRTLALALSLLGRLKPEEALGYLGKWSPKFPVRALYLKEGVVPPEKAFSWGFNTLITSEEPFGSIQTMSLKVSDIDKENNRHQTLLDLSKKIMSQSKEDIFFTNECSAFLELDFVEGKRMLSFSDEAIWDLLIKSPRLGTPLLPMMKLSDVKDTLPKVLSRMVRQPFQGLIIELESIPQAGSDEEKSLFAAGFGCYLGLPPEMWF